MSQKLGKNSIMEMMMKKEVMLWNELTQLKVI